MPFGLTNDESGYIYSSYSIGKTLHDVNGQFLPLSFNLDNSFSPVPVYLMSPFISILGVSPFTGRFMYAVFGIGVVILVFLLTKKLLNYKIAIFSAFAISISVWHLQVSRSAYEAGIALFFYILSIYIFVLKEKNGNILWSVPALILAFYSYHGTKVFYIFLIPLLILIYKNDLFKRKKELISFIFITIAVLLSFFYISSSQKVTRGDIFLWNDNSNASRVVNWEREKNTSPALLRKIFSNKPLYYLRVIRENYLEAISPQFLFLYGETSGLGGIYGTFFRGTMYIIELPLLILGFILLLKFNKRKTMYLLFLGLLISPLSSAFTIDKTYVMRSIMMLPFLCIMVGCGIYYFLDLLKKMPKIAGFVLLIIFVSTYAFLISEYLYQYYFRYNIYGAESWFGSTHELSDYIWGNKDKYKNIYVAGASNMFFLQYGIYNKIEPAEIQKSWKSKWPVKIGNVIFLSGCIDTEGKNYKPGKFFSSNFLYIASGGCHKENPPIANIKDRGEPLRVIWKMYTKI